MFSTLDIIITITMLVLMLIPGWILAKCKLVSKEALPALSAALLFICQPFLSFKVFALAEIDNPIDLIPNMAIMAAMSTMAILAGFAIALIVLRRRDAERAKVLRFAAVFGNCGFIGIPIVSGITNNNAIALIYTAIFIVVFNLLLWTLGVFIITGDKKSINPKKMIINPPTLAFILAVPFFFFPQINVFKAHIAVSGFISLIGDMTIPLSMLIVGVRLAYIPIKEVFTNWRGYIAVALKQAVETVLVFAILYPLAAFNILTGVGAEYLIPITIVMTALPTAASLIAFCERLGGDAAYAAKVFLQSTLTSIITLPAVLTILYLLP